MKFSKKKIVGLVFLGFAVIIGAGIANFFYQLHSAGMDFDIRIGNEWDMMGIPKDIQQNKKIMDCMNHEDFQSVSYDDGVTRCTFTNGTQIIDKP